MLPYKVEMFGLSDRGRKRNVNEDTFFVHAEDGLGLVADGMGGHQAGEVASSLIAQVFKDRSPEPASRKPGEVLKGLIEEANARIIQKSQDKTEFHGMGSTVTALLFGPEGYTVAQVGDSRAYLLRDGRLQQITEDHSLVQAQINMGVITKEQAKHSRLKHILTRSMGGHEDVAVDLHQGEVKPGDIYLLCSDGFHGELNEEEIANLLALPEDLPQKARNLINFANDRDGSDNITVVLARVSAP
jgi:protein phosphatase